MREAIRLARSAEEYDEVPVGAIVVKDGQIIGEGFNTRESSKSPLGHAEIMALERASQRLGGWRLNGCDLYVTVEPCLMCAGAIQQARISNVFLGVMCEKGGALGSLYKVHEDHRLNHQFAVHTGLLSEECGKLMSDYFSRKRETKKKEKEKLNPINSFEH
jgi:tRNA(adenine34) deaminase